MPRDWEPRGWIWEMFMLIVMVCVLAFFGVILWGMIRVVLKIT